MANLSLLADLSTSPITRQTLFDMWDTAVLTSLSETDLSADAHPIIASDSAPSQPSPGQLWVDATRKLVYVWTDEVDNTAVSLWLAVGPDRLETPCLLAGPAAPGAWVEAWYDRVVKVATPSEGALGDGIMRPIGPNQHDIPFPLHSRTAATAESGTWIPVAIEGIAPAYAPAAAGADSLAGSDAAQPMGIDPANPGAVRSAGFWTQRRLNPVVAEGLYTWASPDLTEDTLLMVKLYNGPRRTKASNT